MNDEPSAPGLNLEEVAEIQKHLSDVPNHLIPSEMQKIEMKLDKKNRKLLENQKDIEFQLRAKLDAMRPHTRFARQQLSKLNSQLINLVIQRGSCFS
jgi:uncharacterized NAD(P)/FAD-binding protein YdhS